MRDTTDWKALYLEERDERKRLTDALIALKREGFAPPFVPTKPKAVPGQPTTQAMDLSRLEAQIKAYRPDATPEEIVAEARTLAASFLTDA